MKDAIGLYIHIPFCKQKCLYCDFPSFAGQEEQFFSYAQALIAELNAKADLAQGAPVKSVFFGGGTPTVLPSQILKDIMEAVKGNYNILEDAEITIESNPGTIDEIKSSELIEMGFNRLSMGLQAWQNRLLRLLGRIHTQEAFVDSFLAARKAGFQNINVDLMFALPTQEWADWAETLEQVIALAPEHISAYSLIIEEGTPFYDAFEAGKLQEMDEELDRKMYYGAIERLKQAGYHPYEISNFAMAGKESVHNKIYWQTTPYLGFGLGAHSYTQNERFHNTYDLATYIGRNGITASEDEEREVLSADDMMSEFLFMGLRMSEGISFGEFLKRFGKDIFEVYGDEIRKLIKDGLLEQTTKGICLSKRGVDLSNQVFIQFLK